MVVNNDYLCDQCSKHEVPDGWCKTHKMWEAEGGPCAECERLGQKQLDQVVRFHWRINDKYVKYYQNKLGPRRYPAHAQMLQYLIRALWTIGKDQCLLDCMRAGYSACVAWPEINRIHDKMNADYIEWEASQQPDSRSW